MKIRSVLAASLLLIGFAPVSAEDLILDGQNIPLAGGSSVSINPVTGDITATSANGNLVCTDPGAVSVSNFSASPNPVEQGQQLSLSWSSSNASSCSALGDLPGWSGASIGTQGPFSFTVTATPDTYTARVECTNGTNTATSPTLNITVEEGDPDAPTISGWQASPTTLEAGENVTFDWTSTDADSCQAAGNLPGWSGSQSLQGPETITVPVGTAAGTYSARLQCSNPSGTTTSPTINITVQEGTIQGCDNRPDPSGMVRDTAIKYNSGASTLTWQDFFGTAFPNGLSQERFHIEPNKYAAIEFTTGSTVPSEIQMNYSGPQHQNLVNGFKVVTISECPGDFGPQDDPNCRWTGILASSIRFGTSGGFTCNIEPNTRYFWNFTFSEDTAITSDITWSCSGGGNNCGGLVFGGPN